MHAFFAWLPCMETLAFNFLDLRQIQNFHKTKNNNDKKQKTNKNKNKNKKTPKNKAKQKNPTK